ncbi:ABC transporter ATP-binding protein [Aspergillus brunneoviolaceus CBS 621.78]|uniref:P-loop containing nucleoside triphosphate hydrolase protein n=1 Tax=Aspergillus brunneoviolaceus CBS 621.78 TaxID=1450534 RepID=A0ACD1GMD4_9EURO|nr:P-loop containing nucleoside triphosphate hydrolase protein [Aspergillus brunneoviolaceus CBS 621.78]RAH50439.1 P-loop containing nucleoside triphosphate hydrolase protein [Aspergillus brunneoviolaceus CBS 621.78]
MGAQVVTSTHSVSSTSADNTEEVPGHGPKSTASFRNYLRVFTYAKRWDNLVLVTGMLAAIGAGITQPLMLIIFGKVVGQFTGVITGSGSADHAGTEHTLNRLCLFVFALFTARFGLASIHKFAFRMVSISLSAAIRTHYLEHLFHQSMHVLDSLPPGHAVGTITSSSNTLQGGLSEKLAIFIESTTLIIASFVVALMWSWELSLVTIAGFVATILGVGPLVRLTAKSRANLTHLEGQAASIASESFAGIRMVMACGAQRQTVDKYGAFVEQAKEQAVALNPLTSLQFSLTFFGVFGTIALTFWYGTLIFTRGRLDSVGVITVVLMNLTTIFFSLDRVSSPIQAITKASLTASEFFFIIDTPVPPKGFLKSPDVKATDDIVFEKVSFAYPSRPSLKILDQLDLRIEAGKITAIVGPSGSGKSTIVGLIEHWYSLTQPHAMTTRSTPQEGSDSANLAGLDHHVSSCPVKLQGTITTSGYSLDDIDVSWWRSKIGLVQQEPFLFNDSIYGNVVRGLVGTPWEGDSEERKRERVQEACQEAYADEFINRLPLGYDTNVGDGGARLSGGQRQRLAIARAIVKRPDILILDEATSAIDVSGERIVQAALDKAAQHRTTIVIAHRLSTIRNADQTVVLKKGKVVESGTHQSLVAMDGGFYRGLVDAQAISLGDSTRSVLTNDFDLASVDTLSREAIPKEPKHCDDQASNAWSKNKTDRGIVGCFFLLFLESRAYWSIMVCGILASAAAGTAQPLYAWMFARSIDMFKWQSNHTKLMDEADLMGAMWTVFAASAGAVYFVTFVCSGRVASLIRAKYQTQYFGSILYQRAGYFENEGHSLGTLTARVRDDPVKLEDMMGINIAQLAIALFNIVGGLIIALAYGWKLALVSMCAVTPLCVFSGYIRFRYELQFESLNDAVFAESSQFASEAIGAFRTVTSLTLERSIIDRFERLCQGHVNAAYKKARWVSIVLGFSESVNLGCQALIFYYGGHLFLRGEIGTSLSFGPNAAQAAAASGRMLEARATSVVESPLQGNIPVQSAGVAIELRDVYLRYPGQESPVLNGLNMTIEAGQFAAIVGASGCGKTSIISLLERFHEPEKGQVLFNGQDISQVDIYAYRKHLSLVAQEPILFQGTIRENILLGVDSSAITDDQLQTASRDALIHNFIMSLPEGYSTNIGSRGVALSGGQKQRLAIARALIRNPRLLLLDEATSALDSESERFVQAAFERAGKGRTMIAVAHRLATVQNADIIFVLGEGGRLLEKGSHLELLRKRGVYYQMCQNQAFDQ